jgi:hypothetical protein
MVTVGEQHAIALILDSCMVYMVIDKHVDATSAGRQCTEIVTHHFESI